MLPPTDKQSTKKIKNWCRRTNFSQSLFFISMPPNFWCIRIAEILTATVKLVQKIRKTPRYTGVFLTTSHSPQ